MKPLLKLSGFTLIPAFLGYYLQSHFSTGGSSLIFMIMILGGVLIAPMFVELMIKLNFTKARTTNNLQVSRLSGFLFIFGLILFSAGLGYSFAS